MIFVAEIQRKKLHITDCAGMAELADAQASGACGSNIVWVQVPLPAFGFDFNLETKQRVENL